MEMKQIANFLNTAADVVLGKSDIVSEDLAGVVDLGTEILNARGVDNYVRSLVDVIGRQVFVIRSYKGRAPSVLMDGWEYGSILEKINFETPKYNENESWKLTDGESYDQDIFKSPKVSARFFSNRTTFEVPMSITEKQFKSAMIDARSAASFVEGIYNSINNSMTLAADTLIMRTICNMIGETVHNAFPAETPDYSSDSKARVVNLLHLFKVATGNDTITADSCLYNRDFLAFASSLLNEYSSRLANFSTLFNCGGKERFSPSDRQKFVMLSQFKQRVRSYLYGPTFNKEDVQLPDAEEVPYWQGSGQDYSFANISEVSVKTSAGNTVEIGGVLAVLFDHDALGVTNYDPRTTTHYNAKAEFTNVYFKRDAGYFNDLNENFVVFYVE